MTFSRTLATGTGTTPTRLPGHREYKGLRLVRTLIGVKVFWNSCFLNPIYIAPSLNSAMRWVDAYRAGEHWAVEAKLAPTVG